MASTIKVDNVQNTPGTNIINKCSVTTTVGAGAGETVNVCAATVNLGRSGGTVNLTCGASQTGFGRTGTVDWQTGSIKTALFTAANGEGYFCNTSGGAFTVNLPAGVAGNIVSFSDYTRSFATYNLTIAPDGSEKIGGIADDATLDVDGQSATFVYVDGTEGWVNIQETQTSVTGTPPFIQATGGTITTCGNFKIHKFTGPGCFSVSNLSPTPASNALDYVVVSGGGAGGPCVGAGGGAGGTRFSDGTATGCYTAGPAPLGATALTATVATFPITIGAGTTGNPGSPSNITLARGSPQFFKHNF